MVRLRQFRKRAGLTQAQLAVRAGVSRQLIGAVEAGRHLPRVDAAIAIAAVLGVDVDTVFSPPAALCDILTGEPPAEGALVRIGRVGENVVTAPVGIGTEGWDVADGRIEGGAVVRFTERRDGLVVAGCEPGLQAVERMLRENGIGAVSVSASSRSAIDALVAGRVHAAVVHGPALSEGAGADDVVRFGLATWRVGLAGPLDALHGWWRECLSGRVPVVQREIGAGVQRTFEENTAPGVTVPGPRVANHVEAAAYVVSGGVPAVTIEPAALAFNTAFHPLATHQVELWVAREHAAGPIVGNALDAIASKRFRERLTAIGGYDLSNSGSRVA
jgi:DNA-binding XRE family transcriptional regulator